MLRSQVSFTRLRHVQGRPICRCDGCHDSCFQISSVCCKVVVKKNLLLLFTVFLGLEGTLGDWITLFLFPRITVVDCNVHYMFGLSQPANVSSRCLWTHCIKWSNHWNSNCNIQTPLSNHMILRVCCMRRNWLRYSLTCVLRLSSYLNTLFQLLHKIHERRHFINAKHAKSFKFS